MKYVAPLAIVFGLSLALPTASMAQHLDIGPGGISVGEHHDHDAYHHDHVIVHEHDHDHDGYHHDHVFLHEHDHDGDHHHHIVVLHHHHHY